MNLKPCPFCGGTDVVVVDDPEVGGVFWLCNGCKVTTQPLSWNDEDEWNTRPIEDALSNRIAELEADNHRMLTAISEAMKGIGFCSTRGEDYAFECLRSARDNTKAPDALGEQQ